MKAQNKKSRKILAGLLSSAIILGASGTSGIPLGLSAIAEPAESDEPAVQTEPRLLALPFEQEETGGDFKDIDENCELRWHYKDNVLTISGTGAMPDWDVNWQSNNEVTMKSARPWENFKDQITKIVIGDEVTSIGNFAFCNLFCHDYFGYVLDVEIGSSVETIGMGSFYNSGFTQVVIPENVQTIGIFAFGKNWHIQSVLLTNNTTYTQNSGNNNSFSGSNFADISSKITSLESYSGDIENTALSWSYDPKTHTLEITGSGEIPDYNHSDHFTNDRPWQDLRNLIANIVIGNGVTSIGKYAFCDIWSQQWLNQPLNITFGRGVETIDEYAFANCYTTEVVIPANVKTIGSQAFGSNWDLNSIKLLSQETVYQEDSFTDGKKSLSSIITHVGTIGGKFSEWEVTLTQDENKNPLDPPKTVKPFPNSKLSWSYDLETHTLTISGEGDMPDWVGGSEDYVKENTADHWQNRPWEKFKSEIENVVIENGVTSIGNYAFCTDYHNGAEPDLKVTIPDSVTSIGKNAFYNNIRLKELAIPDTVTTIKSEAFWHCINLKKINLPPKLTLLERDVFRDCQSLESIVIPDTVTKIEPHAFDNCINLTNVVIPENVESIGKWAFAGCESLEKVVFEGTTTIPELYFDVFIGCPCVKDGNKGLIIKSCEYLDQYIEQKGWGVTIYNSEDDWRDGQNKTDFVCDYLNNIDKTHNVTYSAEGAVIKEECNANGCHHVATATLSTEQYHTYTGSEIKPVINTYSDNWYGTGSTQRPKDTAIVYSNNTLVGTAEATLTITNDNGEEATSRINFEILPILVLTIYPKDWEGEYDGEPHTIDVDTNMPTHVSPIKITYSTFEDGTYEEDKPSYTDVGDYTIWCRVETPDGQVVKEKATVKITPKPITDDMVTVTPNLSGGKPTVTVKDGDTTLTPGTDYTLVISGPTKNPTTGENKYEVKVTGKGNYKDPVTKPWYVIDSEGWDNEYDGQPHSITVSGYPDDPDTTIKYGTTDGVYDLDENPAYTNAREEPYTVYYKVTLPNGQVETGSAVVNITPKPLTDDMVTVTPDPDNSDNPPTVTVKDGDTTLEKDTDYTLVIDGPTTDPGTGETKYEITVTGKDGSNYDGTVYKTIPEETGGIHDATAGDVSKVYDGVGHSITVENVPTGASVTYRQKDGSYKATNPAFTDVGKYTVYYWVELDGKYVTKSATVEITPKPLTDPTITVNVDADPNGGDPTVTVKDGGKTLEPNKDYTVAVDPDTGKITITGTGNYKENREETIPKNPGTTTPGSGNNPGNSPGNNPGNNPGSNPGSNPGDNPGSNPGGIEVIIDDWSGEYDGDDHSAIVIKIPDGATITYGTKEGEYDSPELPTYTEVGENTVYYKVELPDGQVVTGTATVEIAPKPVTDPAVTVDVAIDPNNPDTPKVTVKDGDKILTPDVDYTVSIKVIKDTENGEPQYEVTIIGMGNYTDEIDTATTDTPPSDGNNPNPGTGSPIGKWTWILLSAAAVTGVTVVKSKSKRKKS